jgi:GH15 family glucan-1,4-alpha-glucosidase
MRYETQEEVDGLPPGEGAFLACSFWLADNLAMQGRLQEAHDLFDRLLALRNDVGLLAEQYDPVARRLVGNFPQAFSHVSLVNTAVRLDRAKAGDDVTSLGVEDIPEDFAEELAEMAEDQV